MNWCIAAHDYNRLLVHAAVVEKDGKALIFPATPGSGKSTLSAYLAFQGWNLYSDEMAVIDCATGTVAPLFRPVCLKNESIQLVRQWFPEAVLTATAKDTRKGDVAHLKALSWRQFRQFKSAKIAGVVFPRYRASSKFQVYEMENLKAFRELCRHAFNYNIVGMRGFRTVSQLVTQSRQYSIAYSDLADVNQFLLQEFAS